MDTRIACPVEALEEYHQSLYCFISDASKDAQGFRTRFDISEMTTEQLERQAASWSDAACEQIAWENEQRKLDVEHFEQIVARTIQSGAGDRATALRWLMEAEDEDDQAYGWEWFRYHYNLGYHYDIENGCT